MKIKNLSKKERFYKTEVFKQRRAGFVLCLIIMALIACPIYDKYRKPPLSQPLSQTISHQVIAQEDKYSKRGYKRCYDAIICIRDIGEELGFSNRQILTAIRIAKAESGLRTDAINKNSNGTFDIGIFQINDVHSKRISRTDRFDMEKNISFAYKLRTEQGNWNAWSVCRGKVDCE